MKRREQDGHLPRESTPQGPRTQPKSPCVGEAQGLAGVWPRLPRAWDHCQGVECPSRGLVYFVPALETVSSRAPCDTVV